MKHGKGKASYSPLSSGRTSQRVLTEAEKELLHLLKSRGIHSICDSISKEISYAWAVTSGFQTLANVGNFYFACAGQVFEHNPALDFFAAGGMQLALFALHKFVHNETVLLPVLESIRVYTKLHVVGALDFLAVKDANEILMKCARFHDNKHNVIEATCQAIGSLVMNDLVKDSFATPQLLVELLGFLNRYGSVLRVCRSVLTPLGFLVTDGAYPPRIDPAVSAAQLTNVHSLDLFVARMTEVFIDGNGIALVMTTMKTYVDDSEVVWHAIGILNSLNSKALDLRLIFAISGFTGVPQIVEAVAAHVDTEEIAVEGFQLLSRMAALPETYRVINQCKVLDLAYIAMFAYSGPQHQHTRMTIKTTLHSFQKCTVYDSVELSLRERPTRKDMLLYALFVFTFMMTSAVSVFGADSYAMVRGLRRQLEERSWAHEVAKDQKQLHHTLHDVSSVADVWQYLKGPMVQTLFASRWYNGEDYRQDVHSQLGRVDKSGILLGDVVLRMKRGYNSSCEREKELPCYSTLRRDEEHRARILSLQGSDNKIFLPRLSLHNADDQCDYLCALDKLEESRWIDRSKIVFDFASTGGVFSSLNLKPVIFDRYRKLVIFSKEFYCDMLLFCGLLWHTKTQLIKLLRYRLHYFVVPAHLLDLCVIALLSSGIVVRIWFYVEASNLRVASETSYVDLEAVASLTGQEFNIMAACALLMWWRLLSILRSLKMLKHVLAKLQRAEDVLTSFLVLLTTYVLAFGQIGVIAFSSRENLSSIGRSVSFMSKALVRDWSVTFKSKLSCWGIVFRLCSMCVILNVVAAILRERFASRTLEQPVVVPDGLSILELAKQQIQSSRLIENRSSFRSQIRQAARRRINRIRELSRNAVFTSNEMTELSALKDVWRLRSDEHANADKIESARHGDLSLEPLLRDAEDNDRMLSERLSFLRTRLINIRQCVSLIQRLHQDRLDAKRAQKTRLGVGRLSMAARRKGQDVGS